MIDINSVWLEAKSNISGELTAVAYLLWIDNLLPLGVKNSNLVLLAPSLNAKRTVDKNYKEIIKKAVSKAMDSLTDIDVITEEERSEFMNETDSFHDNQIVINTAEDKKKVSPFIPRYTFDNFVVGESNRLAFHAAMSVAQNPGSAEGILSFNPLFIYGSVGIGKTHLLHSIGNFLHTNLPSKKVLYVATEKLTNDYVEAISNSSSSDKNAFNFKKFNDKYRNIDVLMIDDVQFLQKKTGLQDVVFNIFNELYQNGKQIILTSDRPPKEIGTLEDRLRSRFEGGLLADIGTPNLEMRIAIIRKKMMLEKIAVHDDVVYYLAEQIDSNVRELEGALSKVVLYATLVNKPCPDIETAKLALQNGVTKPSGDIDSQDIISAVCSYFKLPKADVTGKRRTKDLVEARMIAVYLIYDILGIPLATIGQLFGGRDHTTIAHSRDKILNMMGDSQELKRVIQNIRRMIMEGANM